MSVELATAIPRSLYPSSAVPDQHEATPVCLLSATTRNAHRVVASGRRSIVESDPFIGGKFGRRSP